MHRLDMDIDMMTVESLESGLERNLERYLAQLEKKVEGYFGLSFEVVLKATE